MITNPATESPAVGGAGHDLPFELHSKIFLHCLPLDGRVRPSPQTAPLLLAQICSQWRAVALEIPQLWSSIFFEFPKDSQYYGLSSLFGYEPNQIVDPTTALVDSWLTRSRGYPISVTIRCREPEFRLPHGLIESLKKRSTQWARLELKLSGDDFLEFSSVVGPFPCLQRLAMDCTDSPRVDNLTRNNGLYDLYSCTNSPALKTLRLGYCVGVYPVYPFTAAAASTRLTTLEFWGRDSSKTAVFYELFPNLQHLILHNDFPWSGVSPGSAVVPVVLHLRCLILHGSVELIGFVSIPTLEHLGVTIWSSEGSSAVVSFLARSRCDLVRLTVLRGSFIPPNIWSALLPVALTVAALEFDDIPFVYRDRPILFPQEGIFPRLRMLSLVAYYFPDIYDEFIETLRARRTLHRAHLRIARGHSPDLAADIPLPGEHVLTSIDDFARGGMVITLETPTFRWPQNIGNDLDGDYNVFDPEQRLPSSIFVP